MTSLISMSRCPLDAPELRRQIAALHVGPGASAQGRPDLTSAVPVIEA
jgi:hypothetical protein